MKRGSYVLLTLMVFLYLFTGVLFAQTVPELAVAGQAAAQTTTPMPTPNAAQTTTLTPTVTQAPVPTAQTTPVPTPQTADPTNAPTQTGQTQTPGPTATPTPMPPTPTPEPKRIFLPVINKEPPVQPPINSIITAPFDLVMSSLPRSYYSDEGLAPETNKILLFGAFLCLLAGMILLKWPEIAWTARRMFAPRVNERKAFPYLTGRALTK